MMTRYNVIGIGKASGRRILILPDVTEGQAKKFCEEWGWSYDDGENAYWLDYTEGEYEAV